MKFLIWLGAIIVTGLGSMAVSSAFTPTSSLAADDALAMGTVSGIFTMIFAVVTFFIARALCRYYDENRRPNIKKLNKKWPTIASKAESTGMPFTLYVYHSVPKNCIEKCEQSKKHPEEINTYLKELYDNGEIERDIYEYLYDKYI